MSENGMHKNLKKTRNGSFFNGPCRICMVLALSCMLVFWIQTASGVVDASFTFDPDNQCSPMEVIFTPNSTDPGFTYEWDFGDGNTSEEESPTHTFVASPGDDTQPFDVQLTVTSGDDSDTHTRVVTVKRPPSTQLFDTGWPAFAKCTGDNEFILTVQNGSFTDNVSHEIDWGDGSDVFTAGPEGFDEVPHNYGSTQGYWDLEYTVEGANTCVSTEVYPVLYNRNPALGVTGPEGTVGCAPLTLDYAISHIDNNMGTEYTFTFNDGSPPYFFSVDDPPPSSIIHTFDEASCEAPDDVFTLTALAENLCGYQQFTIEPIAVDREPIAGISAIDTICLGEQVTFYNVTEPACGGNPNQTTYIWNIDGEDIDVGNSTAPQTHDYNTPGNHTVSLTATNPTVEQCNGGTSIAYFDVYVIDDTEPDAPSILGPDEGCRGQHYLFNAEEVDDAGFYRWALSEGQIVAGQGTTTMTAFFGAGIVPNTVQVQVRAENVCNESEWDTLEFQLLPLPDPVSAITGDVEVVCEGEVLQAGFSIEQPTPEPGVITITWEVPAGAEISDGQGTKEILVDFSSAFGGGEISVYASNDCGYTAPSKLMVGIDRLPLAAGDISGPVAVCEGDTASFSISAIDHASYYVWLLNGDQVTHNGTIEIDLPIDMPAGSYDLSVYGENDCGTGPLSAIFTFTVNPAPEANFLLQHHCFGNYAFFTDEDAGHDDEIAAWSWNFGDGYSSSLPDPMHIYDDIGTYSVTLMVATDDNCRAFYSDFIEVLDIPVSQFSASMDTVFAGQPVQFTDESSMLHNPTEHAPYWHYDFGDGTGSNTQNPTKVYEHTGTYTIRQTVDIDPGMDECPDESYMQLMVVLDIFIPNAFAPGGGGGAGSGSFGPALSGYGASAGGAAFTGDFVFMVFNRWGERIYFERSADPSWDGTIRGGPPAPAGVYVWRLNYEIDGNTMSKTGSVMLLR